MMKKMKYIFLALSVMAFFTACKDSDSVSIDSLQVFGNEFYYGQVVEVAMAVNMSNPDVARFEWQCDEGKFLEEQGYQLNRWQAPSKAGYYTIRCTATCGSAKETREATVYVSGFFFENFNGRSGNAVPTGWAQSNSGVQLTNNRMELYVSANGQSSGEVRYTMTKTDYPTIFPPFSFKSDVGIVGKTATSENANVPKYPSDSTQFNTGSNFNGRDNNSAYSIIGAAPSATVAPTYFISELRLEWWPTGQHCLSSLRYMPVNGTDTVTFIPGVNFDALIRFQWTRRADASQGIPQSTGWLAIPIKTDAFNYFDPNGEVGRNISMAVTEDYIVQVFVGDANVFETDQIKNWRANFDNAPLSVSQYKFIYPAKTRVYLDNVYFFLDSNFGK